MENFDQTSFEEVAFGYLKIVVREIRWLTCKEYEPILHHLNPKFVRADRQHYGNCNCGCNQPSGIYCDFRFNLETGSYAGGQIYSINQNGLYAYMEEVYNNVYDSLSIRRCGMDSVETKLTELSPEAILTAIQEIEISSLLES